MIQSKTSRFAVVTALALPGALCGSVSVQQDATGEFPQELQQEVQRESAVDPRGGEGGEARRRLERASQGDGDEFSQHYGVLVENNIFLRDRRARREAPTAQTTQPAPPPRPETEWVLVGVVFEEGQFRAYFESVRGGGVKRAVVGDPIAAGAVADVFIDSIGYATPGGLAWIEIGQDLTGEYVVIPGAQRPAATAGAPADSNPAAGAPSQQTMSIEERLRMRRMQEQGGARPAPGRSAPPPGDLPPDAIIEGDMLIVPAGEVPEGAQVEVLVVPQRLPPPTDQPQRRPD